MCHLVLAVITSSKCKTAVRNLGRYPVEISAPLIHTNPNMQLGMHYLLT